MIEVHGDFEKANQNRIVTARAVGVGDSPFGCG